MILVDGDTIAYRASASCEPTRAKGYLEPETEAIFRANAMMIKILEACKTEDHIVYFSCSAQDNFRYKIDPFYKIKRRDVPKPTHYSATVDTLFSNWKCQLCFGYEADDGIGINHMEGDIIAANDKDLLQIPGRHFNFVKEEFNDVTDYLAQYQLWHQMLEGDPSDGVVGVPGIGKVKAANILLGLDPAEMGATVMELYDDPERFTTNFKLLRILRSEDEYHAICHELESRTSNPLENKSLENKKTSALSAESP